MSYTNQLIKLAKQLEQPLSVEHDEVTFRYKVSINMVGFKDNYVRHSIFGLGFTIEDAAYDLIRKARGGKLTHYISEKEVDVI